MTMKILSMHLLQKGTLKLSKDKETISRASITISAIVGDNGEPIAIQSIRFKFL